MLIIFIASLMGIDTNSIIMVLIIFALFIAIAMQTSMANIGSGLMLYIIKPFKKGDYIKIEDKEGYFQNTSYYHTTLKKRDNIFSLFIEKTGFKQWGTVKTLWK